VSFRRVLRYAEQQARRGSLTIPSPSEVAVDPSRLDRFLAAYERLEASVTSAPEPMLSKSLVAYVARSYMGTSQAEDGWPTESPDGSGTRSAPR
jgi:hypothetical protein